MQDVIIVGAGPAGLSVALSLSDFGLKVVVIEKQTEEFLASPAYDGKEIALTHLSKQLLQTMGAWNRIPEELVSLIKEAKVINGNSAYALHFDYKDVCDSTLGYLVSNHQIRKALYEEVKTRDNIELLCGRYVKTIDSNKTNTFISLSDEKILSALLVIAADSRFSTSRRYVGISAKMLDFGKAAVVCKVTHELSHNNTAYECFLYGSTMAVLPLPGNESSVVITIPANRASFILNQNEDEFNNDITARFNSRFGKMKLSSERFFYSLVATYADKFIANRFALIGDAAVGMHPVTAHGFNLGLKGQNILAKQIGKVMPKKIHIASDIVLSNYNIKYRRASRLLYMATNGIVQLYTNEKPITKVIRKTLLRMGNIITPAKKAIMHQLTEIKDSEQFICGKKGS